MESKITIENQVYEFDLEVPKKRTYQLGPHEVEIETTSDTHARITLDKSSWQNTRPGDLGEWLACTKTGYLYSGKYAKCAEFDVMNEHHVCFGVAFWIVLGKKHANNPLWFRVNGTSYLCQPQAVCTDRKPRGSDSMRGFGGRTFEVMKDGIKYVIDDMWCQGDMPEWFRAEYPDNATFCKGTW